MKSGPWVETSLQTTSLGLFSSRPVECCFEAWGVRVGDADGISSLLPAGVPGLVACGSQVKR